jgi:hypothetical protein
MKKILFSAILSVLGYAAMAQAGTNQPLKKSAVPEPVIKSYLSQNSGGATDTIWEKETITIYKVKYIDNNRTYESQFSADGKWIKTFTIIDANELPVLVVNQLKTTYPEYGISKAMIELSSNGKLYAVEITKGKNTLIEYFLMNGRSFSH